MGKPRYQLAVHVSLALLSALVLPSGACSQTVSPGTYAASGSPRRDANVLLITIDTLRADYLSCYGGKKAPTPNIDALAARGVRFANAFAQVPLTPPSHACILTGAYPQAHKIRDIGGFVLDGTIPTLATITRDAGFETAAFIGAAVLNRHFGLNRGFNNYNDDMMGQDPGERLPGVVAEIHGDVVTRRAVDWLKSSASRGLGIQPGKNFFLWVHYYDPHFPYDPPEPFRSRAGKDLYGGEVAYTDAQIGQLLKGLADQHLQDRTLIMLLSDHGESLGEHGENTHGVFLYDSTMRVPLILAGPGVPGERVVTQQVRSIDVMPTIADYLGISNGGRVQGTSLMPAIALGQLVRTNYSFMETLYPKTHLGWSELRGMRTDEWKVIIAPKPELYKLASDRGESKNVVTQNPTVADQLQKKIWEITGPPRSIEKVELRPVDEQTRQQLQSLGYASAGARRELRIDMSGPDPKDRTLVLQSMDRAADLINHDRFAAAVPLLENLLPQDPTNPLLYRHLGLCFQRMKEFRKALRVYQQAVENKADTDRTYAEMGNIYVRLGDLNRAAQLLEQSAKINATDLQTLENLANTYLQLGRLDEAERALRSILAQNNRHAAAYNLYGILEIQRNQSDLARGYFQKAVELNPNLTEVYMNLGLLAEGAGQTEQARSYYKKFLEKADPVKYRDIIPKVKAALQDLK
ncbi:MAG TPA: sulfatase-like hydrolase/transferase [Acidobacteriota bacterium]|jgi:arylsulfatase A-like enzyme/tetratricopeptide (TPR) repeat protein|nr:sulfatase-like hydrolase/transferase [Acidobacteriota bacterium]